MENARATPKEIQEAFYTRRLVEIPPSWNEDSPLYELTVHDAHGFRVHTTFDELVVLHNGYLVNADTYINEREEERADWAETVLGGSLRD